MRKNEKWKKSHSVCSFTILYSCSEVCWKRLWHTLSLSWCLHVCLPALYHSLCLSQWSSVYFNAGVPSLLSYGGNDEVCYISLVFHLSSITLSLFNSLSFSLSLSLFLSLSLSHTHSFPLPVPLSLSLCLTGGWRGEYFRWFWIWRIWHRWSTVCLVKFFDSLENLF